MTQAAAVCPSQCGSLVSAHMAQESVPRHASNKVVCGAPTVMAAAHWWPSCGQTGARHCGAARFQCRRPCCLRRDDCLGDAHLLARCRAPPSLFLQKVAPGERPRGWRRLPRGARGALLLLLHPGLSARGVARQRAAPALGAAAPRCRAPRRRRRRHRHPSCSAQTTAAAAARPARSGSGTRRSNRTRCRRHHSRCR